VSAGPHIIIADYNLPDDLTGVETIRAVWQELRRQIPAMVVSGDSSPATLRAIAASGLINLPIIIAMMDGIC
jgi:CheY-like chemotaxis protein